MTDNDVINALDDDVMMTSMSEVEFKSKNREELRRICVNWKQITVFEISVSSLRRNPHYVQVRTARLEIKYEGRQVGDVGV